MSAYLTGFAFPSFFSSGANQDDGFWQEPSTIKTRLTAANSSDTEMGACPATTTGDLTARHTIAHRRNKSMQLHYAAPSA